MIFLNYISSNFNSNYSPLHFPDSPNPSRFFNNPNYTHHSSKSKNYHLINNINNNDK